MTSTLGSRSVRRVAPNDHEEIGALIQEAFRVSTSPRLWEAEGFVCAEDAIGAIVLAPEFGMYFGGRCVDAGGITGMAVAPEQRGRGVGGTLVRRVLEEQRRSGVLVSILYPSSLPFYRRLGYELAGTYTRYQAPCCAAPAAPNLLPAVWDDGDLDEIARFYDEFARAQNGLIDRTPAWWRERVLAAREDEPTYRYVVREDDAVTGYCVMIQEPTPAHGRGYLRDAGYHYATVFRDLVWRTETAARSLLALVAAQRTLGSDMLWHAAPEEPLMLFFEDAAVGVRWTEPIMARLLDVPGALRARGFRGDVDVGVTLAVDDPWFEANRGPFRLTVSAGLADVARTTSRAPEIDVGALASLYTGYLSATDLVRAGRLRGASAADVRALDTAFCGSRPWLPEHF